MSEKRVEKIWANKNKDRITEFVNRYNENNIRIKKEYIKQKEINEVWFESKKKKLIKEFKLYKKFIGEIKK